MVRSLKQILSLVLTLAVIVGGMPGTVYSQSFESSTETADPFELMVDTAPDLMTAEEIIESAYPQYVSPSAIDISNIYIQPSDYENVEEVKGIITDAMNINSNEADIVMDLALLDDILEQQQDLIKKSKIDRFIVKYTETGEVSFKEKVGDEINRSIKIGDVDISNNLFNIVAFNKTPNDFYEISPDTVNLVNWAADKNKELLILNNPVNPNEFAEVLKENNIEKDIEYIQPDFQLELQRIEDSSTKNTIDNSTLKETDLNNQESIDNATSDAQTPVETTAGSVSIEPAKETATDESTSTKPVESTDDATIEVIPAVTQTNKVIIAMIDTGIDITHPDLKKYIYVNPNEIADNGIDDDRNGHVDDVNGWSFQDNSGTIYDESLGLAQAHATHLAGIIAGLSNADNNLIPNDNVSILPIKVFNNGTAYTSDIIAAIDYAEKMDAKIVNCSFGSTDDNQALNEAIENSGMLFICSAGNARSDLEEMPIYPACFDLDNIISVTSTNIDGGLSYFSNYNSRLVDVAALGRDINSTLPNGEYGLQSGTSMSTALVSGIAAVVLSTNYELNCLEVKERLLNTSDMLSNLQEEVDNGRQISTLNAMSNLEQTDVIQNLPESDFDVMGYNPTQTQLFQLYNSSKVVQIAQGAWYSMVLKNDGTVWAWGSNGLGQCGSGSTSSSETLTQVIGLTDVVYIAAGFDHSLAVKSDGTVWAWGSNGDGQLGDGTETRKEAPVQVSGLTGAVSVAAGEDYSLALKSDGTVWAWGSNGDGQLGDGTTTERTMPVQVSGLTGAVSVAAGRKHSLALKSNGTAWSWGENYYGQLGRDLYSDNRTPAQMRGLTDAVSVAAGAAHSLALKSDGTVWTTSKVVPGDDITVRGIMDGLTGVVAIAAGHQNSLAVKSDGTVWAWGDNNMCQLGDGTMTGRTTPVPVSGLTGAVSVGAAWFSSMALKSDGTVWAWGTNNYGLGDGTTANRRTSVQVRGLTGAVRVAAGEVHSLAIKLDGTIWAWGTNNNGQLGDGTWVSRTTPVQVSGLTGAVRAAAGKRHSLALKSTGSVWAWGYNVCGQLGDGTWSSRTTPVQVSGLTSAVSVAAGDNHSLALKSDGTVWACGDNDYGQLGDGKTTDKATVVQVSGLTNVVGIAAGESNSLAVKSDGTVWAWGKNDSGQLGDGTWSRRTTPVQVRGLTSAVSVAAGYKHSLALKSDGTVWACGDNDYGQLGDGTTIDKATVVQVSGLTNVVGIAAGENNSLAVKSDGTVWAWGKNDFGQLGDGTMAQRKTPVQVSGLNDVTTIATGYKHSLAVKTNATVMAWGSDLDGQLGQSRIIQTSVPIQCQAENASLTFEKTNYTANIPATGLNITTVSAIGTDFFGKTISASAISYSLSSTNAGVSINSSTGAITIDSSAKPGSIKVTATYQNISCSSTLTLTLGFAFENINYTVRIPNLGLNNITISAIGTDSNGNIIPASAISYSLSSTNAGVTINSSTGAITIDSSAQPGLIKVTATYQNISCSSILNLIVSSSTDRVLPCTLGDDIYIPFLVNKANNMNNIVFTLNYNTEDMDIIDLVSQTKSLETTIGIATGSNIEIIACTQGAIIFKVNKSIPNEKSWSSVINVFKFKSKITGQTTVTAGYN